MFKGKVEIKLYENYNYKVYIFTGFNAKFSHHDIAEILLMLVLITNQPIKS